VYDFIFILLYEYILKYSYIYLMKSTKRQFSVLKLQQVAKILKTISHPVKLEILEVLESNEPLDVSSICNKIGINCEISMMSHHLSKMKDNGVLVSEKKGKQVFYKIADRQLLSIFDCMEGCDLF
jgi:DNA-binding transcriptional ArsR family regulator